MNKALKRAFLIGLFCVAGLVSASMVGDLIQVGWYSDGKNLQSLNGAGYINSSVRVIDYTTTSTARTILASETGTVFTMSSTGDDPTTFTLPAAVAGLTYTFIDRDATAAADLTIEPQAADKIEDDTAGDGLYSNADNATGQVITLTAIDGTNWIATEKQGTWAQK